MSRRKRMAIVTTEWRYHCHAWHMAERFLVGNNKPTDRANRSLLRWFFATAGEKREYCDTKPTAK